MLYVFMFVGKLEKRIWIITILDGNGWVYGWHMYWSTEINGICVRRTVLFGARKWMVDVSGGRK